MKHSTKIRRRSETQIRTLLSLQQKQDIAVKTFCQAHKIHKATFYNWRNKYNCTLQKQQEEFVRFTLGSMCQQRLLLVIALLQSLRHEHATTTTGWVYLGVEFF